MTSNEKNQPDSLLTESVEERKENELSLDDEINFFEKTAKQNESTLLEWAKVGADFGDGIVAIRQKITECRQLADWLKELKSYREHNSIHASSENRVKLEHIECEDAVNRTDDLISRQEG